MTLPYDWNPMPHVLAIECPACEAQARFEFAECVVIARKQDVSYFERSKDFEYVLTENAGTGRKHLALYFNSLDRTDLDTLTNLPEGYTANDWAHSDYSYRSHGYDVGTITCARCGLRRKHQLEWPADAFYQIAYKAKVLWAFDRETAITLMEYIRSTDRNRVGPHAAFLRHVPKVFMTSGARDTICAKFEKLLRSN
ncbi:MAG: hypothetical protein AAF729_08255 [Pseudomonadota bacterium]